MQNDDKKISKLLSFVLRHQPGHIGLELDEQGWAPVDELLAKLKERGTFLNREKLEEIVASNNKKRFAFNEDQTLIRASQGHSVPIDLQLVPLQPPEKLFHGTATRFLQKIMEEGLTRQERRHVHLSAEKETAVQVGSRHGKPVVLEVAAARMQDEGYVFYRSENAVWLTDAVPPIYLSILKP